MSSAEFAHRVFKDNRLLIPDTLEDYMTALYRHQIDNLISTKLK